MELNWTKTIKGLRDTQQPLNRIHDIFTLNIGSTAVTVLVTGKLQAFRKFLAAFNGDSSKLLTVTAI